MRKHYNYDSYRGRSPLRTLLKVVAVLLALILILGVAGLLFLEPYWVYSSDGAQLRLPWTQPDPTPVTTTAPLPSTPIVVVTPQVATPEPLHAALLPRQALYDGSTGQQLEEAGAQAALFDMKADDGTLGYSSALEHALSGGINPTDDALNAAIESLNRTEGLYTVARVSCFRDNLLPKNNNTLAIRSPVGNWRDNGGHRWLSPSSADARAYVTGICLELAALGFDEILLDNAGYPIDGNLDYIIKNESYDSALLSATVDDFYATLGQTLAGEYPALTLSVLTSGTALEAGHDAASGQTTAAMVQTMDRVWTLDPGAAWAPFVGTLEQEGLEDPEVNLVTIVTKTGAKDRSWCLWP